MVLRQVDPIISALCHQVATLPGAPPFYSPRSVSHAKTVKFVFLISPMFCRCLEARRLGLDTLAAASLAGGTGWLKVVTSRLESATIKKNIRQCLGREEDGRSSTLLLPWYVLLLGALSESAGGEWRQALASVLYGGAASDAMLHRLREKDCGRREQRRLLAAAAGRQVHNCLKVFFLFYYNVACSNRFSIVEENEKEEDGEEVALAAAAASATPPHFHGSASEKETMHTIDSLVEKITRDLERNQVCSERLLCVRTYTYTTYLCWHKFVLTAQ